MEMENVFVYKDIILIMVYVDLENLVLHIVKEIIKEVVDVFQDINYIKISALDVQMDKYGLKNRIDVLFLVELMKNLIIRREYVNVKRAMVNFKVLVRNVHQITLYYKVIV